MVELTCGDCGTRFTAQRATRRFCSQACQKRARRADQSPAAAPVDLASRRPAEPAPDEHPMVTHARERLAEVGRLDTWEGQAALKLASDIAASTVDTLSARATATEKLAAAMDRALKGIDKPASAVQRHRDQLAERRRARAEQAG